MQNKPKIVYKMQYAILMQLKGHKVVTTLDNPKNNNYKCWVFEDDQTFDSDLHQLIENGRKNQS